MTTAVNERDVIIEGADRIIIPSGAALILTTSAPSFHIKSDGSHFPDTLTVRAALVLLNGPVSFSVVGGVASNITATTCDIAYSSVSGSSVEITATAANDGSPVSQIISVGVVTDGSSSSAAYVSLSSTAQVFSRANAQATFAPGNITLTATPYGGTATYQWQYWNGSSWIDIDGATSASYTAASSGFTDARTYRVQATINGATYTDQETLVQVTGGTNAVTGFLTNESVTFAADNSGTVSDFSPATGSFHIYDGIVDKTGSGLVTYSVQSESGCVVSIDAAGTVTVQGMSADTASANLQAVYGIVTLTKVLSLSKSRAGAAGGATFVVVSNNGQVFGRANAAASFAPTTLTLTATPYGGSATYQWQYLNAGTWTNVASGGTASTYTVNSGDFTGSRSYRVQATINGSSYYDQVTLVQVTGGTNAISGFLTNETAALPATSAGTVSDFSGASGTFKVFDGLTDVTTGGSVTFTAPVQTNCTVAITSAGAITVSAMTADSATATLQAVYNGVTIQKILSLAKAKQGAQGNTGSGTQGPRGTVNIAASGYSAWNSTSANTEIANAGYSFPINRDIVTLYGTGFSETRFYNNGTWIALTAYVNGNMLVSGTLSASQITTGFMSASRISGGTISGTSINIGGNFVVDSSGVGQLYTSNFTRCTASNGDAPGITAFTATSYGAGSAMTVNGGGSGWALAISGGTNGIVQTGAGGNFLRTTVSATDIGFDLGSAGNRWVNIYASSGVINTSDTRVKTDVADTDLGLAFINELRPVKYKMLVSKNNVTDNLVEVEPATTTTDADGKEVDTPAVMENQAIVTPVAGVRYHYGLLAQEVKQVLDAHSIPDCGIWTLADKTDPESRQALRYEELIGPLIKAVQELAARVVALENK